MAKECDYLSIFARMLMNWTVLQSGPLLFKLRPFGICVWASMNHFQPQRVNSTLSINSKFFRCVSGMVHTHGIIYLSEIRKEKKLYSFCSPVRCLLCETWCRHKFTHFFLLTLPRWNYLTKSFSCLSLNAPSRTVISLLPTARRRRVTGVRCKAQTTQHKSES